MFCSINSSHYIDSIETHIHKSSFTKTQNNSLHLQGVTRIPAQHIRHIREVPVSACSWGGAGPGQERSLLFSPGSVPSWPEAG